MGDPAVADPKAAKSIKRARPDLATLSGLVLAFGGIAGGLIMEGGRLQDVAQITSALIVLGGTLGAVMITTPLSVLIRAGKQLRNVFFSTSESGLRQNRRDHRIRHSGAKKRYCFT